MTGFKRGEMILESAPYAYALKNEERGKRCDYCCELNRSLKRCSGCTFVYYCNKECQRKAWEYHRDECKYIKILPSKPSPCVRILIQVLLKIKRHGYNEPYEMVGGKPRCFSDLESHAEDIMKVPEMLHKVTTAFVALGDFFPVQDIPEFSKLVEIYGKIAVNNFSIYDMDCIESIGTGVYLGASVFDHSCEPDAEMVFDGIHVSLRAVRDMDHRDVRKVHICYIDRMQLTEDRQKQLKECYFFECQCKRCTDATLLLRYTR